MCATCVAQGVTYVGGALGALQVMRAKARLRRRGGPDAGPVDETAPAKRAGTVEAAWRAGDETRSDARLTVEQVG